MPLVFPKDVGGVDEVQTVQPVEPIEVRSSNLTLPADVGGVQEMATVQEAPETGIADIFTGSERIAATPELGTLPEFGTTEQGNTFKVSLGLLSTFDTKAQTDIIKEAIPEANFETTQDGSVIIETPKEGGGTTRSVLNRPGFSPQDLTTSVAQILSFLPAAKLASLGRTVMQKVGLGAAGAGATEQALQETGIALGREERDPASVALSAGLGGAAEAVFPAIQAVRGARQASTVGAAKEEIGLAAENVQAAKQAAEKTGVPLFQAQQTLVPAQLEKQSFVASLPAGTQEAVKGIRKQNVAASNAVEDFLGQIAPDKSIVTGADKFRTASQTAIDAKKRIRSEATSPIYKQAFRRQRQGKVDLIDTAQLQVKLKEISKQFDPKGQISKNMESALDKIKNAKGNLQKLHLAKTEIDQTIESFGADAVGNTTKRFLTGVKKDLVEELVKQSPSYRAARDEFIRLSPEVTAIRDSIIGKVANLDDVQLKQVSGKIFDPAQTNPTVVANAKKIIDDVDPEAWNQLVRVELEKRLGSIKADPDAGTIENIPSQLFRALFPNNKSTKVLMNSLDAEGKKNLTYLKTALSRARLGRPGGSQTAAREEIKQELRGGITQSIRNFISSPLRTVATTGEDIAFNKRTRSLAKALFDPTWKAEMKQLRKLSSDSPAAARAFTQLLNDIENTEEE